MNLIPLKLSYSKFKVSKSILWYHRIMILTTFLLTGRISEQMSFGQSEQVSGMFAFVLR
jgi:hypothetical protein